MSDTAARRLRKMPSPPEAWLWRALRIRTNGLRFRRKHPVGPFVVDFYCTAAAMAIEVDGDAHNFVERQRRDAERDAWLQTMGVITVRFMTADVFRELDAVVMAIVEAARRRTPPSAARPPPPEIRGRKL